MIRHLPRSDVPRLADQGNYWRLIDLYRICEEKSLPSAYERLLKHAPNRDNLCYSA